jgi:hypothetical protein
MLRIQVKSHSTEQIAMTILNPAGESLNMDLSRPELLALVAALGEVHFKMHPNEEPPAIDGTLMATIPGPRWYVRAAPDGRGCVIAFYHPCFGPVSFEVPGDQSLYMAKLLSSFAVQSEAPRATPQ